VVLGADRICGVPEESQDTYRKCVVDGRFDYQRWGTEGLASTFPLSFLRLLPNMIASHISIAHDARGPNNTIHEAEVSSLLAIREALRVIQRVAADVMLAGGASSRMQPFDWVAHCTLGRASTRQGDPAEVLRPFDADRSGEVYGEGAAVFVLETRRHAEARGATILARVLGAATACETGNGVLKGAGLRRAMALALGEAGLTPADIGHVNAHGAGVRLDDAVEASAIREVLGDVPVTAPRRISAI
jgi:3-oxoacyl-[acyl-carrier-protein] synthase II